MISLELQEGTKVSDIAFRRPTFKNPLPTIFRVIVKSLKSAFVWMIEMGENAGRAKAARHLANMGYYEAARDVMLGKGINNG
jgi:hypothetical protein